MAAPVSSVALYAARGRLDAGGRWRAAALPVLLWHQVEEWVWPGGFIEWLNREVLGSNDDLAPLTPARAAVVNVGLGWGMSVATAAAGGRVPAVSIGTSAANVANAAMHLGWTARHGRWDPGAATSALLLAPWGVAGLRRHLGRDGAPQAQQALGLAAGAAGFVGVFASARKRRTGRGGRRRARP